MSRIEMDVEGLSNLNSEYESNPQAGKTFKNYIPSRFAFLNLTRLKNHVEWKYLVAGLFIFVLFVLIITVSMDTHHDPPHPTTEEPEPEHKVSWVNYLRTNYSRNALKDAVSAGFDNGFDVFVIQTLYNGELIPGKLIHHQNQSLDWIHSFFPIDGKEMQIDHFKLLVDPDKRLKWTPNTETNLVQRLHAVVGGKTRGGEDLHIGRTKKGGSDICGKVDPSHTLFYTWQGKVESTQNFDILVFKS